MLNQPARRSLLALVGATAGLASVAAGSTAAAAQSDPEPDTPYDSWLPPDTQAPPMPAQAGTCTGFRDFLQNNPIEVLVPTTASGNGNCLLVQGNQGAGVKVLQRAIFDCYPQARDELGGRAGIDAIFGPDTREALQVVQRAEGISDDGAYGTQTKNNMRWPGYLGDDFVACRRLV